MDLRELSAQSAPRSLGEMGIMRRRLFPVLHENVRECCLFYLQFFTVLPLLSLFYRGWKIIDSSDIIDDLLTF